MSRSRKKNPWLCDRNPWMKNYANRRIRRSCDFLRCRDKFYVKYISSGGDYKKYTSSYNICDFKYKHFKGSFLEEWKYKRK